MKFLKSAKDLTKVKICPISSLFNLSMSSIITIILQFKLSKYSSQLFLKVFRDTYFSNSSESNESYSLLFK